MQHRSSRLNTIALLVDGETVIEHHVWAIAELVLLEREGQLWGTGDELDSCDSATVHA